MKLSTSFDSNYTYGNVKNLTDERSTNSKTIVDTDLHLLYLILFSST